jgi:hypothetical protein
MRSTWGQPGERPGAAEDREAELQGLHQTAGGTFRSVLDSTSAPSEASRSSSAADR